MPKHPNKGNNGHSTPHSATPPPPSESELIVIAAPAAGLRARAEGAPASLTGADVTDLASLLAEKGATLEPLFGPSEEHLNLREAAPGLEALMPENLGLFYRVDCAESDKPSMAVALKSLPSVEAAFVKPGASPAVEVLNAMTPRIEDVPPATPDFVARQGYLGAAPAGVDAQYASSVPGGRGAGIRVIDIEGAWRFSHEDLTQNQGGLAGGTASPDVGWRNHGTAVIGEIGGDLNGFGVTGIAPDANVRGISIFGGMGSAGAIRRAADLLQPGDVLLIELHRPGPLATGVGQQGFIAIEWWPDDYAAIRYAIARGIVVVEAAGNGAQNLDNPAYDNPDPGFPASWRNPFRRGAADSGAILVGAGAPPPGTHGRNHGPDRSRLDFSNFGAAVDVQGWGREVTTCAYGDLQGGPNEDVWYTDQFSGTSSASPIIVGVLAAIQGVRKARALPLLTPASARALLRSTGSPQTDAPGRPATERIGNRPNLRQMIAQLQPNDVRAVPLYRYWNPTNTDHFYTTNWSELGSGRYGWHYEGVQCYVFASQLPGTVPLYRYWNPTIGDHFYTTNWNELGSGRWGWKYEGVQCYVHSGAATGARGLYRYWNPTAGDHFYTTDWNELGSGRYGWHFEGVQCYVQIAPTVAVPIEAPVMDAPQANLEPSIAATGIGATIRPESYALVNTPEPEPVPETFSSSGSSAPSPWFAPPVGSKMPSFPPGPSETSSFWEKGAAASSFHSAHENGDHGFKTAPDRSSTRRARGGSDVFFDIRLAPSPPE